MTDKSPYAEALEIAKQFAKPSDHGTTPEERIVGNAFLLCHARLEEVTEKLGRAEEILSHINSEVYAPGSCCDKALERDEDLQAHYEDLASSYFQERQ
jgi:hypothetical protein